MINEAIRGLMKLKSKDYAGLAAHLGLKSTQAVHNKLHRNTFTANDLIRIAEYLDCNLALIDGKNTIVLDRE